MRINHGLRNGARIIAKFRREFLQGAKGDKDDKGDQGIQGVAGADGQDGEGLMAGGQQGQILAKSSNADFDAEWVDAPVGGVLEENAVSTEIVRDRAITAEKIAPNAIVVRGSAAHMELIPKKF